MIEAVHIRNWQSLKHLDLALGRYTVIVGASSSGKTALMRAFKALASNVRGTGQLTRGASTAAITAFLDEGSVTLEYRAGAWRYETAFLGHEETFTALAGKVPEAVTNLLRIAPVPAAGTSINFAGQFDRPYLLSSDDSGAKVARTLGELTNAHIILEAVREGVRRRNMLTGTLKIREKDLADAVDKIQQYAGLPARLDALSEAETLWEEASKVQASIQRASTLQERLRAAEDVVAKSRVLPEVPSADEVQAAQARLAALDGLRQSHMLAQARLDDVRAGQADAAQREEVLERELMELLAAAGRCPTCGQSTTDRIQLPT